MRTRRAEVADAEGGVRMHVAATGWVAQAEQRGAPVPEVRNRRDLGRGGPG